MRENLREYVAEMLGTLMWVLAAIVVSDVSHGAINHVDIAVTFGLIVLAVIYTYGDISGTHINPAVMLAFWLVPVLGARSAVGLCRYVSGDPCCEPGCC